MWKNLLPIIPLAIAITSCTSKDVGPYAPTAEDKSLEQRAASNAMCAIENQARCDHLIENRTVFARFFTPETFGNLKEDEKIRGRRVTTKFVVEAVAAINQCNRVTTEAVTIVSGMEISGGKYLVQGTSPLTQGQSKCFITPAPEGT